MNVCTTNVIRGETCGDTYAEMGHALSNKIHGNATVTNTTPAVCAPGWVPDEGTNGWLEGCTDGEGHLTVSPPPGILHTSGYTGCEGWCTGRGYAWATMNADGTCACADLTVHETTTEGCPGSYVKRLSPIFDQVITAGMPVCYMHLQQPCTTLPDGAGVHAPGWYNDALGSYGDTPATTEAACQSRQTSYWSTHCAPSAPAYFYSNGANTLFCDASHQVQIQNVLQNSTTTSINQSQLSSNEATARIAEAKALERASDQAVSAAVLTSARACDLTIDTTATSPSGELDTSSESTLTLMGNVHADAVDMTNTLVAQVNGKCRLSVDLGDTGCDCRPAKAAGCEYACTCDGGATQIVDLLRCVMGNTTQATQVNGRVVPYAIPIVDALSSTVSLRIQTDGSIGCDAAQTHVREISTCTADNDANVWESPESCSDSMAHPTTCPAV